MSQHIQENTQETFDWDDLRIPGMSGLEMVRRLRAGHWNHGFKVPS